MLKLCSLPSRRHFSSSCVLAKNVRNRNNNISNKLHDLLSNMPKEEVHLKDMRKMRMEKRTKRFLVQPTNIYWQVLGSGSYGGPTSLFLNTDHRKYMFNCGEGTQRLTNQLSLSKALAQLEHVFITSKTWKHLGGLPGVCLSVRSAGAPDITIHGPPGCMELYEATKGFVTLFEFDVLSHTAEDGVFEDGAVKVEQVKLHRTANKKYPTPAPVQDYNPDIGQTNVGGYGVNKDPYCHMVEKVVFENQCEPYTERTCYTQNKESCVTKPFRNCTGVIETNIERVCFDVNELVCDLVEAIHYETLEETYQVQRCFTGKDRVCDTTYKIDMTTKDDYQCTNVETPNCYMEEKVINDVTCTNSVEFNCKRDKSTKNDGYGPKGVVCDRKPTQSCYNIPRKIQVEVCKTDVHRYCEKFSNIFPFPVEEQNCHFEPKKICELEMKTRPKKAKKYSYTKDCKEQPREICDQCEKKSIQPLCDTQDRLVCTYEPVETCNDVDKQYCHKVEKVVLEEECDMKFDTRYL